MDSPQQLFWASCFFFLSVSLAVYFLVRERHVKQATPFRLSVFADIGILFRSRQYRVLMLVTFGYATSFWGATPVASIYALELVPPGGYLGWGVEAWVGAVALGLTISTALALPVWGRLLDRYDPSLLLSISLVLGTFSSLFTPLSTTPLWLAGSRALLGLLGAGMQPAVMRLIKDAAPVGMDTRALAMSTAVHMLAAGVAPILAGWIAPALGMPFYFSLNVALLLMATVLWIRETRTL